MRSRLLSAASGRNSSLTLEGVVRFLEIQRQADIKPGTNPDLHVICERDVGLFSLIQQVIANVPWALNEKRTPVAYFSERTCYWTPRGYGGRDTVWEYYFEPIDPDFPVSTIPQSIKDVIANKHPQAKEVGYPIENNSFVSNHFGDHPELAGKALSIPYLVEDPDARLRLVTSQIIRSHVRPRSYIIEKTGEFFENHMSNSNVIGVHVRGTDAASPQETRPHRQGSLSLPRFIHILKVLLRTEPDARIFVATDAKASLDSLKEAFGARIIAYDSLRHEAGEPAGSGPTGWIMPAYIATDRDRAARNGEEAVIEYLLLSKCQTLLHNGSGLARSVLLKEPGMTHINTHRNDQTEGP